MHYPGHMRERFLQWIDEGCPAVAIIEVNYEERLVPARRMLLAMLRCSDVLPWSVVEQVSDELGLELDDWRHTYGEAARRLQSAVLR